YFEFKEFFPENAVEYFVSYYDYYQPESYIPVTDTYIPKETSVNENIDLLRHSATRSLISRKDVIVVSSVSCLYGLGSPEIYRRFIFEIKKGQNLSRHSFLKKLVEMHYERNDTSLEPGKFRARGDTIDLWVPGLENPFRVSFFGDEVDYISILNPMTAREEKVEQVFITAAKHYLLPQDEMNLILKDIEEELEERCTVLKTRGKLLEEARLRQRTKYDLELLKEIGFCPGIENYSRYLTYRKPGEPPYTLIDFFPENMLVVIDESHVTLPQIKGMYGGDRGRKDILVEFGFRLPSCRDNRPLTFTEFFQRAKQVICVSATPGELEQQHGPVVRLESRPTGLLDPTVEVRPTAGQLEHLLSEIQRCTARGDGVLVTTMTKKFAESLTEWLTQRGVRVRYLHSDIETIDRTAIIDEFMNRTYDVIVGINLLREGLDLPRVALIAILDADKEGFLRSTTSLIQIMGRASRNINGHVILYADTITDSMAESIKITQSRRRMQEEINRRDGISPSTIVKSSKGNVFEWVDTDGRKKRMSIEELRMKKARHALPEKMELNLLVSNEELSTAHTFEDLITVLRTKMKEYAGRMEFEKAAVIRDAIKEMMQKEQSGVNAGKEYN
ncbi:MAG: excinuclease ABC subunit UvrB, partial [Thermoplasmata archaeon]